MTRSPHDQISVLIKEKKKTALTFFPPGTGKRQSCAHKEEGLLLDSHSAGTNDLELFSYQNYEKQTTQPMVICYSSPS